MLNEGDVARIEYRWPRDEQAGRADGSKVRACTVIACHENDGAIFAATVVPHHGLLRGQKPRPEDAPYAIRLSPRLQRSLGLLRTTREGRPDPDEKESWILAHHTNIVSLPQNPAVRRTLDPTGNPAWSSGRVPDALLQEIREKNDLAKKNGHAHVSLLRRDDGQGGAQGSVGAQARSRKPGPPPSSMTDDERRESSRALAKRLARRRGTLSLGKPSGNKSQSGDEER